MREMKNIGMRLPDDLWFVAILLPVVTLYRWRSERQLYRALSSAMEACLGYFVTCIGVAALPLATNPLLNLIHSAFGVSGAIMNSEAYGMSLLPEFGSVALLIMFAAFAINVLLARLTPFKGVFLTAHHLLYMALFTAMVLQTSGLPMYVVLAVGALLLGLYGWIVVSLTHRSTGKIMGIKSVGLANSSSSAALIGRAAVHLCGSSQERYTRESGRHSSSIGGIPSLSSAGLFINYILLCLYVGPERADAVFSAGGWLFNCLARALLFGALTTVLLSGIRMLLSSVVELFHVLADRYAKGCWMGLDATAIISICPRAWNAGFFCSCLGSSVAMAFMLLFQAPFVPVLSPSSMYFAGGVAGVCGNAWGNKQTARIAGFLTGAATTLVIGAMAANLGNYAEMGVIFGETEYGIYGLILETIGKVFSEIRF